MKLEGSGCDTVGRAVASDTRGNPNPVIGKLKKETGKGPIKKIGHMANFTIALFLN